jgi:hypothetical protein
MTVYVKEHVFPGQEATGRKNIDIFPRTQKMQSRVLSAEQSTEDWGQEGLGRRNLPSV